ncbi:hypothetical protein GCM10009609_32100 [Pseudonocardia aurantiaca]|uniref:GNAT family N-acetyltransferase n=1 Tax=Pseudonocardia aurantiaca TaxID=75290 RepID=A0ABW4FSR7_9PSEU
MSPPAHAPLPNPADQSDGIRPAAAGPTRSRKKERLPTRPGYAIRELLGTDLPATAQLHIDELPVGLFPRLGRQFVRRWHRAFLESSHAVALSAVRTDPRGEEYLVGFLIGATDREAFKQELVGRHRNALMTRGVLALVLRPHVLIRFLRTRTRPYLHRLRRAETGPRPGTAHLGESRHRLTTAELTAIVVAPALRRSGAGQALIGEFLGRCAAVGTPTAELTNVSGPRSAADFYSRTGWTEAGRSVTFDGQQVLKFRHNTGHEPDD